MLGCRRPGLPRSTFELEEVQPAMIMERGCAIVISNGTRRDAGDLFDLAAASEISGMHPEMICEFGRARFVGIAFRGENGAPYFDRDGVGRLRQIEQWRRRPGRRVDLHTIRYITRLLDRLDRVEQELLATRSASVSQ